MTHAVLFKNKSYSRLNRKKGCKSLSFVNLYRENSLVSTKVVLSELIADDRTNGKLIIKTKRGYCPSF